MIQIIGEAFRFVAPGTRPALPMIPWQPITGMRRRVVHDSINTDYDIVGETAARAIPELLAILEPYVTQRLPQKHQGRI